MALRHESSGAGGAHGNNRAEVVENRLYEGGGTGSTPDAAPSTRPDDFATRHKEERWINDYLNREAGVG